MKHFFPLNLDLTRVQGNPQVHWSWGYIQRNLACYITIIYLGEESEWGKGGGERTTDSNQCRAHLRDNHQPQDGPEGVVGPPAPHSVIKGCGTRGIQGSGIRARCHHGGTHLHVTPTRGAVQWGAAATGLRARANICTPCKQQGRRLQAPIPAGGRVEGWNRGVGGTGDTGDACMPKQTTSIMD